MAKFAPLVDISVDTKSFVRLEKAFRELGGPAREKANVRAVNHVGNKGFTRIARETARQAGLQVGETKKAMRKVRAHAGDPRFRIIARGRHFAAFKFAGRQTKRGASAAPWKKRRVFPGTFVARSASGHVGIFKRTSSARLPVKELWGPAIPIEMIKGEAKAAFDRLVDTELMKRFEHELAREVDRVKAKYGL